MKEKVCYVIGSGDFDNELFSPLEDDFVIAADGGYMHLKNSNIPVDLLIGDFDSLDIIPDVPRIIKLKKEKDDTDLFAAISQGLKQGYKIFHIYGGTGGRFEHTLANIQLVAFLSQNNARGYLFGNDYTLTAITNTIVYFDELATGYLSVFSHTDKSFGVTIKGLKYPLNEAEITNTFSLGISNCFMGQKSSISVKNGTLVLCYGRDIYETKNP